MTMMNTDRERGTATLVGLALSGFVLLAGLLAADVGAVAGARAAAQTAADLAALAALTPGAGPPAARSRELAAANGAELLSCACSCPARAHRCGRRWPSGAGSGWSPASPSASARGPRRSCLPRPHGRTRAARAARSGGPWPQGRGAARSPQLRGEPGSPG
jgi:Putative Flp pilus-assembly TadE/G-like